jgi:hypothetical protein
VLSRDLVEVGLHVGREGVAHILSQAVRCSESSSLVEAMGIEPTTYGLQSRRSAN